jgi:ubiquinone/menaquinone biosynthesis C-methylase UbiE
VNTSLSVERGYARWAHSYDRNPNPLVALEQRCLMPLLPDTEGTRVLDLACGTGRWAQLLLARGAALVIGIDVSAAMLRAAQKKPPIRGRLVQADCMKLPFPAAMFDLIVCSFAVEHIHEPQNMVHELGRVAQDDANVFVTELHPEAHSRGWRIGFRDEEGAVQIEASPHPAARLAEAFCGSEFECGNVLSCVIGEPERPLFVQAGKEHIFEEVRQVPAVLILHFKRRKEPGARSQEPERGFRFFPPGS